MHIYVTRMEIPGCQWLSVGCPALSPSGTVPWQNLMQPSTTYSHWCKCSQHRTSSRPHTTCSLQTTNTFTHHTSFMPVQIQGVCTLHVICRQEMGIQVFTDFDLLGPSDNVTFDTADYIPLEVLEGNENARSCISRAYARSRDPIQNVRGSSASPWRRAWRCRGSRAWCAAAPPPRPRTRRPRRTRRRTASGRPAKRDARCQ
jgi:hypothetical protein